MKLLSLEYAVLVRYYISTSGWLSFASNHAIMVTELSSYVKFERLLHPLIWLH